MAALLLVGGVIFAVHATAVTPLTASTSNQHIENQQRAMANDLLAVADENGTLEEALVHWDAENGTFPATSGQGFYVSGGPPNAFGAVLNETFRADRIAFNVYVFYHQPDDSIRKKTLVYMGAPSDNAVAASRSMFVYDDTPLSGPDADGDLSSRSFYAPDAVPDGPLYNVLEVRIVTWQM
jgi:hypothetical protein